MAYITWVPDYDLGIDCIDRQHRRLLEIVNRLNDAVEQRCPRGVIQSIVCDLTTYTEIHFSDEEDLMQRLGFPDWDKHRAEHTVLSAELRKLESALAGGQLRISGDVMEFLKSWHLDHICQADRAFGFFALASEDRATLAQCR